MASTVAAPRHGHSVTEYSSLDNDTARLSVQAAAASSVTAPAHSRGGRPACAYQSHGEKRLGEEDPPASIAALVGLTLGESHRCSAVRRDEPLRVLPSFSFLGFELRDRPEHRRGSGNGRPRNPAPALSASVTDSHRPRPRWHRSRYATVELRGLSPFAPTPISCCTSRLPLPVGGRSRGAIAASFFHTRRLFPADS